MISLEKALEIAETAGKEELHQLQFCYDIGNAYAFYFDDGGSGCAGAPFVNVKKNTGEFRYMHIPPISNLRILERGKLLKEPGKAWILA